MRLLVLTSVVFVSGCLQSGQTMTLIDRSEGLGSAPTPAGFTIMPHEAQAIKDALVLPVPFLDVLYHDDDNYYVGNGSFKRRSKAYVRDSGTIINGRTGEVYDRESKSWLPDPRGGRGRLLRPMIPAPHGNLKRQGPRSRPMSPQVIDSKQRSWSVRL